MLNQELNILLEAFSKNKVSISNRKINMYVCGKLRLGFIIFFFKWNGPSIYMNSLNTAKWKDE